MKPRVILIADAGGEIGWGHAVRQLALAEALIARHVPTLFVTRTREALALDWPCPVAIGDEYVGISAGPAVSVYDLVDGDYRGHDVGGSVVRFDDYCAAPCEDVDVLVRPHFGSTPVNRAAFLGPRWAPLRPEFERYNRNPNQDRGGLFVYGPAPEVWDGRFAIVRPKSLNAKVVARQMSNCALALVPPSMVALECLCVGLPVVLYVPGPKWQPIADAMVQAGVAEIWSGKPDDYSLACVLADDGKRQKMSEAGREAVDGRGSERLAEWLADA